MRNLGIFENSYLQERCRGDIFKCFRKEKNILCENQSISLSTDLLLWKCLFLKRKNVKKLAKDFFFFSSVCFLKGLLTLLVLVKSDLAVQWTQRALMWHWRKTSGRACGNISWKPQKRKKKICVIGGNVNLNILTFCFTSSFPIPILLLLTRSCKTQESYGKFYMRLTKSHSFQVSMNTQNSFWALIQRSFINYVELTKFSNPLQKKFLP